MDEELKNVLRRVEELEGEVQLLKKQLVELQSPPSAAHESVKKAETMKRQGTLIKRPTVESESLSVHSEPERQQPREYNLEQLLSVWMPRVFMFILLLGVLWGLKVGMEHGLITNFVRVILGYGGTALLYVLGMRYMNSGKTGFGVTLLGGFLVLGILTTFAAHYLYGYFPYVLAFLIGIGYIAASLWLSKRIRSETLTVFSAIAGFLLPFLLQGENASPIQFCLYMLILFLSLLYMSSQQRHKYAFYVTFLLFHLTFAAYVLLDGITGAEELIVATVGIQHLSLLAFYLTGRISRRVFSEALIYTNFVFLIGWVKLLGPLQELIVYGGFALLYIGLAAYAASKKESLLQGVLSAVAVFAAAVFILDFQFADDQVQLLFLLINGTVGLWVGFRYAVKRTIAISAFIYGMAMLAVFSAVSISQLISLEHLTWLVLLATMVFIFAMLYRFLPSILPGKTTALDQSLIAGQLVAFAYLFQLIQAVLDPMSLPYSFRNHVEIFIWLVILGSMYMFTKWRRGTYIVHASAIEFLLLGLVVLPMGLQGFQNYGYLFNLFVQFCYVSIFVLIFAAVTRKTFYYVPQVNLSALAVITQVVVFLFLNKWYVSFVSWAGWEYEFVLFGHTFFLFLYAFLSISVGGKWNWKAVRVAGVVLIGVCLLKLFFLDLAAISILVRAVLFIIVGLVGLLYSRTLLKDQGHSKE